MTISQHFQAGIQARSEVKKQTELNNTKSQVDKQTGAEVRVRAGSLSISMGHLAMRPKIEADSDNEESYSR